MNVSLALKLTAQFVTGAVIASVITLSAMSTGVAETPAPVTPNEPSWTATIATDFPNCMDAKQWPHEEIPVRTVYVDVNADVHSAPFSDAWDLAADPNGAGIWVVGLCDK